MPHIRPRLIFPLAIGGMALLLALSIQAEPRLLHSEPSPFGQVLVFEDNGERCLNFNSMTDLGRQTCMDLQEPDELVFSYTRMMISALFVNPAPRRILIVGLGGATLQKALAALLPDATIDTVEIDPAVARVAEDYFDYRPGPRQRLFVEDGRAYIENARRTGQQYDMVMLDAFDVDYVPEHLMTVEFLEHVKAILAKDGIVVANTFTNSDLYERESATYAHVFGPFFNLRQGNRVIVAARDTLPGMDAIRSNAKAWKNKLEPLSVDVEQETDRYAQRQEKGSADLLRDPKPQ
ncbi:spermidine synthase [Bordetella muralis]|jgi:spermidine synthase|uniref:spermidine synthase n=1 Tax=Bordetella muralis TaxID=1649130 RepID=UPI0039F013AE